VASKPTDGAKEIAAAEPFSGKPFPLAGIENFRSNKPQALVHFFNRSVQKVVEKPFANRVTARSVRGLSSLHQS
jgi:hypothetical protein